MLYLLIAPKGIEIALRPDASAKGKPLLIAPKGIEIFVSSSNPSYFSFF